MSDLEAAYRARVSAAEEQRLRRVLDDAVATEAAGALDPMDRAGGGKPQQEKKAGKKGPDYKGLEVAGETAFEGIKNFGKGIANFIVPPTGQTSGEVLKERGMGLGQAGLGVLQFMMALPAGVGANVRTALERYAPGMEAEPAIKEGEMAGRIRATLGAPSLAFDPKVKEQIQADPQGVLKSLNAPITYGELLDIATQFAVGGVIGKGVKAPPAAPVKKPMLALPPGPQRALPPGVYEAGPSPLSVSVTDRLASDFAMGRRYPSVEEMLAESMRRRRAAETPESGQREIASETALDLPGAETPPGSAAVVDAQGRPVPAPVESRYKTPLDAPERVAETPDLLPEDVLPSGELTQALDIAERRAEKAIRDELSVAPEVVGRAAEPAAEPRTTSGDLPSLPEGRTAAPDILSDTKALRESGSISPEMAATLARVATGAAVGGSQGETTEERILNAFLGAGLGAALSKRLATKVVDAYKSSRLADETGAINRGAFGKKQQEVPYEPNYTRMKTTPQTEQYIRTLYEAIKTDIAQQGRNIRSHVQMDSEALAMLRDGRMSPDRILNFQRGTTLNDSQMKAARHIALRSAEEADALVERAYAGEMVDPKDVTRAIAVSGALNINVRAAIKETGRALSSLRAIATSEGAAPLKFHSERIELVAERMRAGATVDEIMSTWRSMKSVEQRSTFARLYYAIPEALLEAYYGSILSGAAISKNALSILFAAPLEMTARSLAAYMPRNLVKMARGDRTAISPSEGPMGVVAFAKAGVEQLRMLRHFDDIRAQAEALGASRVEVQPHGFEALAQIARDTGHSNLAKAADYLHTGYSVGPEIMRATDGMSKAMAGRVAIQWEAMQRAAGEGLTGKAFAERAGEYVQDYSKLPSDALQRIADAREHMTFTKNLEGRITGALQAGPPDPWLNLLYRLNFATFVRTPARIAEFATEYTPALNAIAKHTWTEWQKGGNARSVVEGRVATGALVMGTFGTLAYAGMITPPEPDPRKREALTAAGRPPSSWWDHSAGKWRSYEGLEPLSTLVGMSATLANYMRQLPESDADLLFLAGVFSWLDSLNAKTYTQAISEFGELMFNPSGDERVERGMKYIRKKLASFLPLGGALKEVERVYDPPERRGVPSGAFDNRSMGGALWREWYALADEYRARLPGLSDAVDESGNPVVPPDRNMFSGEPMVNDSWPFNPWRAREGNDAEWAKEIQRLRGAGLTPIDQWIGRRAGADIGMDVNKPTPPGIRLTPQEYDRLRVLMTQDVKIGGRTLIQSLDRMVQSPQYQAQSDITKKQWLQAEWAEYRQAAEEKLQRENQKLAGALAERRGKAAIERTPPARQEDMTQRLQQILQGLSGSLGR